MSINNNAKIGIPAWYATKSVLVTGATGFLGKVLVEKLLWSCPDIESIYLLVRPKKDLSSTERFEKYTGHLVFDRIRNTNPERFKKLRVVPGDVTIPGLGIGEQDRNELVEKVNVVFHCAASVRFDFTLKTAIMYNTHGTLYMLQLALEMRRLAAFVHVSTTYVSHQDVRLQEKGYPTGFKASGLIEFAEMADNSFFDSIASKILGRYHNTYQFSKALTENLVEEYRARLPIVVARPPIIIGAMKEPYPGYVEGMYGPMGVTIAGAQGAINIIMGADKTRGNMLPVDYIVSATIAIGKHRGLTGPETKEIEYFNLCDSERTQTYDEGVPMVVEWSRQDPFPSYLYPKVRTTPTTLVYLIHIGYCFLFGFLVDFLLILCRRKPVLTQVYKKIHTGIWQYRPFTTKGWFVDNPKCKQLFESLSEEDKKSFNFDFDNVDWPVYTRTYLAGLRTFLCKFSEDSLPQCRKNVKRLWVMDKVITGIKLYLLYFFLSSYGGSILSFFRWTLDVSSNVLAQTFSNRFHCFAKN